MSTLSPEALRRLKNIAAFWNGRLAAARDDAALARVCFDRARAAAKRGQRGGQPRAMHALAELLTAYAEQQERAEVERLTRHGG